MRERLWVALDVETLKEADALLERRCRVDAMQVVERDGVRLQAPKTLLDLSLEDIGTSAVPPSLGADHAAVGDR